MNDGTKIAGVPPKHASINEALAAAQSEMGRALRQSENPHFKKTYADLASVMDACVPALNRHGVAVIQPPGEDESGRAYVETILLHTSGEKLSCKIYLIVDQNNMQRYGSAVTYARRYGLMCMAGIAPEDDDANEAVSSPPTKARPEPPPTADQIAEAQAFLTGSQTASTVYR